MFVKLVCSTPTELWFFGVITSLQTFNPDGIEGKVKIKTSEIIPVGNKRLPAR